MSFYNKIPLGLITLKTWVTNSISTAKTTIEGWCNNRFSLNTHNHATEYDSKGAASAVQTNLNTHVADSVKHITSAERTTWNGKANAVHTHPQSDITGLVTALAGKASTSHTHNTLYNKSVFDVTDTSTGKLGYLIHSAFTNDSGTDSTYFCILTYHNTSGSNKNNITMHTPSNFTVTSILATTYSGTSAYNRKGRASASISSGKVKVAISGEIAATSSGESVVVFCLGKYA